MRSKSKKNLFSLALEVLGKALVVVLSLVAVDGFAQSGTATVKLHGTSLDSLFIYNSRTNYNQTTLDGYRIQIYSGSGSTAKKDALTAQNKFLELYPNEKIHVSYSAPFWRVRVGDYRYRSEAMRLLSRVKRQFPGSYVVRDNTVRKNVFY